jgi:hypothetical protein
MTAGTVKGNSGGGMSKRLLLILAGAGFWVGMMILRTGMNGVRSLLDAIWVMVLLIAITSFTRSISLRYVLSMFFYGGFMMGIAVIVAKICGGIVGDHSALRAIVVPTIEQVLMLVPPAVFLWSRRQSSFWIIGVTDILLLTAASGVGFEMVENAFLRMNSSYGTAVIPWLPLSMHSGDRIFGEYVLNGHALWSCLAGLTLGFSRILWNRGKVAGLVAASGFAWGLLDHIALDMHSKDVPGAFKTSLGWLSGDGYVSLGLFLIGVIAAILFDLFIIHRTLPGATSPLINSLQLPIGKGGWDSQLITRSIAFANFYARRLSGELGKMVQDLRYLRLLQLFVRHTDCQYTKEDSKVYLKT